MKNARIQCKDIPDNVFLFAVLRAQMKQWLSWYGPGGTSMMFPLPDRGLATDGRPLLPWCHREDLVAEFPSWIPEKVLMRKADKLINQNRMEGCTCGCLGSFNIRETNQIWGYVKENGGWDFVSNSTFR